MSLLSTRVLVLENETQIETSLERFLEGHQELKMSEVLNIQSQLETGKVCVGEGWAIAEVEPALNDDAPPAPESP